MKPPSGPKKTNPNKACPELAEALSVAEGAVEWANFFKGQNELKIACQKIWPRPGGTRADFLLESLFPWRYNHPCRWHKETEITKIADSILLFQRDSGGWPKNCDMQAILTGGQEIKLLQ